jgi:hypothetical protein
VKKKAIIFGAGEWGRVAYYYYRESCEIVCYIDNDESIWNTQLNNLPICSPEVLKEQKYTVIIANKRYEEEIKRQLLLDYDIQGVVLFRIDERMEELYREETDICQLKMDELIIAFSHGLGNQMFQYALYRNLIKLGRNVKADLSAYNKPDMMPFELLNVFPNIQLERCNPSEKAYYLNEGKGKVYIEGPPRGKEKAFYKKELLEMESGYVEGFHCSYKYPNQIRQELLEDFVFPYRNDNALCNLKRELEQKEAVSVHIRRGDFLNSKYRREIGNICTDEYYKRAIDYIKSKCRNAVFCFFSNDIEWVKTNMKQEAAIYIEKNMFTQYCDWYDMYLMSMCKHNIIPNSTFGWWGAWLNQNPDKIVVAPKKWRNRWEANDWCPPEWILI